MKTVKEDVKAIKMKQEFKSIRILLSALIILLCFALFSYKLFSHISFFGLSLDMISVVLPFAVFFFYLSGRILIWSGLALKENTLRRVINPIISSLLLMLVIFYTICATYTHPNNEMRIEPFWRKYWDWLFAVIFLITAINIILKNRKHERSLSAPTISDQQPQPIDEKTTPKPSAP